MSEIVVKNKCCRCPRVEELKAEHASDVDGLLGDTSRSVSVSIGGVEVLSFDYVCAQCMKLIERNVMAFAERPKRSTKG